MLPMRREDGSHISALNEQHLTLRDGTAVLIRQLVAEDAALYPDFLSDVTAEDLRLRFFGPMREVSHELRAIQTRAAQFSCRSTRLALTRASPDAIKKRFGCLGRRRQPEPL